MSKEILIVEDDARFRRSLKLSLTREDYIFFEAGSAWEAQDLLNKHPNINVIILDLNLPGASGSEFLEQVKHRLSNSRIIVLTAHEELLAAKMAKNFEVFTYLSKTVGSSSQSLQFSVEQAFNDIERTLLERKIRAHLDIQKRINANQPLDEILNIICKWVRDLTQGYTCHLRLADLKTGEFVLTALDAPTPGLEDIFAKPKFKGEVYSGVVAESNIPLVIDDLQSDQSFQIQKEEYFKRGSLNSGAKTYLEEVRAAYIVPISTDIFGPSVDAVFTVTSTAKSFFSDREKHSLVEEFVTEAALAISKEWQRAKREEAHQGLEILSRMSAKISEELRGVDAQDRIFEVIAKGITQVINPETIAIFLFNNRTSRLEKAAEFTGTRQVENRQEWYKPGKNLVGRVFVSGEPIRLSDTHHIPYYDAENVGDIPSGRIEHYLCVPVAFGREVIGVIRLINQKSAYYEEDGASGKYSLLSRGFSEESQVILELIASYLAVSLRNAGLINKLSREIHRLQTLTDVARKISSTSDTDIDELLSLVV